MQLNTQVTNAVDLDQVVVFYQGISLFYSSNIFLKIVWCAEILPLEMQNFLQTAIWQWQVDS